MVSDVMVGRSRSYFNMQRFEYDIYKKGIRRQRREKLKKKYFLINSILVLTASMLAITLLVTVFGIVFQSAMIISKNKEIATLEISLGKKELDDDEYLKEVKDSIKYDNLKMKAYLELNMITPTDKNIIYFNKSDTALKNEVIQ